MDWLMRPGWTKDTLPIIPSVRHDSTAWMKYGLFSLVKFLNSNRKC